MRMPPTRSDVMTVPTSPASTSLSRRTKLGALALVCGVASLGVLPTASAENAPPDRSAAAPTASTFTDDFNGPAGAAVDGGKWQIETGDNVNNHERQYYTSGNKNAALDGQGNLVITARKENPGNYQCW